MPTVPDEGPAARSGGWRPSFVLLLALALPLLLVRLGAKDVWEASEGRPLESAREMRAHGDWLVQYTNGQVDLTKPPVYAWLTGLAFAALGDSEFAGRLPSVLASLGCLGAAYVLGRRRGGPRAGFLAGLLLLTTAKFLWQARLAELETLLALGVLWAYVAFDAAIELDPGARRTRLFAAFWAAAGFAFAVKGPVALLLVLPGAVAGATWSGRGRALRSSAFLATLPIWAVVALSWYAAVVGRDRAALDTFLSFARGDNVGHLRDPSYYLLNYPLYALPGLFAVVPGLGLPWSRPLDAESRRRVRLPWAAFAATFVLQAALHAKQTHYLIPTVFPMGCVLGGVWLDRWLASPRGARLSTPLGAGAALFVVAEFVTLGWVVPPMNAEQSARPFLERVAARVPDGAPLAWTVFGSHSDYLWYLPERMVGTTGVPELVAGSEAATIERVRDHLAAGPERYAIVTASQAVALGEVAVVLVTEHSVGKKQRAFALVRSRPTKGAR
jgi:4-amino-4-deoxy-L-arabinose transferase-like glycosyltransferase